MIYSSPFPPVTEWVEDKSVFEYMLLENPRITPSDVVLIDAFTGAKMTYAELISDSLRFASGFVDTLGMKHGDTIAIFSANSTLYPVLLFAAQASGVTVTTANSSYVPSELCHLLVNSSAIYLLCSSDLLETGLAAMKLAGMDLTRLFVLPGMDGKVVAKGHQSFEALRGSAAGFKPVKLTKHQLKTAVAYLPFSSGTTGVGKGVEITSLNIINMAQQLENTNIFQKDIVIGVLPLYHIYGLVVLIHQTIFNGGTIVLMPRFDLPIFCQCIERYEITTGMIVPPIALALARQPIVDDYDLSSLRFLICGAAPLSLALQSSFEERLRTAPKRRFKSNVTMILQGYGLTETTSVALLPVISVARPGSCGQLLTSMEAKLVDENGKDVASGESGELWIRGRAKQNIMLGYHKNEKATKETIHPDGWLMTGDVCIRTEDGHYSIVDRTKELIKTKGFQAPPAVIEGVLLECPLVADAAVIGVWYEEEATEYPRAYVVVDPKFSQEPDLAAKITAFVASRVSPHLRIKGGVRFMDVIPKSTAGKILRKDLRVLAAKEPSSGRL